MICSSINEKAKCICSKKFEVLQREMLQTEIPRISDQRAILYGTIADLYKHEISNFANGCRRSRRKVFWYSTVQYGTVQYCQNVR